MHHTHALVSTGLRAVAMYFIFSVSGPVVCNLARLEQILFSEDNYLYMYVENLKMLGQTPCLKEPTRNK